MGCVFKLPIFGFSNDNRRGQALTFGLFALANFATYKLMNFKKNQVPMLKSPKYAVAFGSYLTAIEKLVNRV